MEKHLEDADCVHELQAGFTTDRRAVDNLHILRYCIQQSYKNKKALIVTSLDFKKAFDSEDRGKLIECLMKYNIHPKIISVVAKLYTGDRTNLFLNNEFQTEMHITNGIKQGCSGSTLLFLILTYEIIQKLEQANVGYKDDLFIIAILYFADDGLLLSNSIEDAMSNIKLIQEVAEKLGLVINKRKSNVLIYNMNDQPDRIEDIEVKTSLKYLGVKITNAKNCFDEFKNEQLLKAKQLANISHSIMARSCNRLLIGKNYWKSLGLSSVLYAAEVLEFTEAELLQLQVTENSVYRSILQAPKYIANGALRGEVGASSSRARDAKIKILFAKHLLKDKRNYLNKTILLREIEQGTNRWTKIFFKYLKEINITIQNVQTFTKTQIVDKKKKKNWDTEKWRKEVSEKSTLKLYYSKKMKVKEEKWIDNTEGAKLMVRCRTNSLQLCWRNKFTNGAVQCPGLLWF